MLNCGSHSLGFFKVTERLVGSLPKDEGAGDRADGHTIATVFVVGQQLTHAGKHLLRFERSLNMRPNLARLKFPRRSRAIMEALVIRESFWGMLYYKEVGSHTPYCS